MSPVRMISAGGFVAVTLFGNRASTEDVDYMLDTQMRDPKKAEEKLLVAIKAVTQLLQMEEGWINDSMAVFAVGDKRKDLFRASIEQNEMLFHGKHLIIYAVEWQWAMTRKLIRLSTGGDREGGIDRSDSVELLRRIIGIGGLPLDRSVVKSWTDNIYTPITDSVLDGVAADYERKYQSRGLN
jgi:hypothetical protein